MREIVLMVCVFIYFLKTIITYFTCFILSAKLAVVITNKNIKFILSENLFSTQSLSELFFIVYLIIYMNTEIKCHSDYPSNSIHMHLSTRL